MLVTKQPILRRFWYPVMPITHLTDGPKPFRLLDTDIVLWLTSDGSPAAIADRCAHFQTFFDPSAPGIPMTTTRLQTPRPDALVYQQTMRLNNVDNTVYFTFENIGRMAVFGIAFPTPNPSIAVKAVLPQTFLDIAAKQVDRAQTT